MPKISVHGGASNAHEEGYFDRQAETAAAELTRAENPNAPAPRPGEHVAFFAERNGIGESGPEEVDVTPAEDETPEVPEESAGEVDAPAPPAKRAARKATRGPAV